MYRYNLGKSFLYVSIIVLLAVILVAVSKTFLFVSKDSLNKQRKQIASSRRPDNAEFDVRKCDSSGTSVVTRKLRKNVKFAPRRKHKSIKNRGRSMAKYDSVFREDKSFIYTDSHGVVHVIPYIAAKDGRKIISAGATEIRGFEQEHGFKAFELPDGSVLVETGITFALYPNFDLVQDAINSRKNRSARPVLYNLNPYGKEFPEFVPKMVEEISSKFGIKTGLGNTELLITLDNEIVKHRTVDFIDSNLIFFIAVVGAAVNDECGTHWDMSFDVDSDTWTPFIRFGSDRIFIEKYLLEDLGNLNQKVPLTEVFQSVRAIINSRK